jgi:hypothetical protein
MSHYKGRPSLTTIERDYPHVVEILVPEGGLGTRLNAMYEWHSARGIQDQRGRSRRDENNRDYIRWCFADLATAEAFAKEFYGSPLNQSAGNIGGGRSLRYPIVQHCSPPSQKPDMTGIS